MKGLFGSRSQMRVPWLLFAAAAAVAWVIAILIFRLEDARHHTYFALAASERMSVLEVGIPPFRPVRHLAAAFGSTLQQGGPNADDFYRLAASIPLAKSPAVVALQWIQRERDASGRESFSVRSSYSPADASGSELGVDLADDPLQRQTLETAGRQDHLFVGPWYRVDGQVRFRVLRPIFREDGGGRQLLGFFSGVYRVDRLLGEGLCSTKTDIIDLYIADRQREALATFYCLDGRTWAGEVPGGLPSSGLQLKRTIRIDGAPHRKGAQWVVTAVAKPGTFSASLWIPFVIGAGEILFGGMLAMFYRSLLDREAQVRQLVERRTEELACRTEQLQAVNSELEQFAYVASHDLKAPLRAVSQLAAWIDEDLGECLDDTNRQRLRLMHERVVRMDELIEGLLAYSRAGRVTDQRREAVPLEPLLKELARDLPLPDGFRVEIQGAFPELRADPLHLTQIFQNLITNAALHHDRPASGSVRIRAAEEAYHWRLEVADDGPGIPPEERELVFRMFTTIRRRPDQQHTGIGLAIVKKLVRSYGGQVEVADNPPRGTVFRIRWPKSEG